MPNFNPIESTILKFLPKLRRASKSSSNADAQESDREGERRCSCLYVDCRCRLGHSEVEEKLAKSKVHIDPKVFETYSKEMVCENLDLIAAVSSIKYAFKE